MAVSLKGFNEKYVTLLAGTSCTVGKPVEITAANTAGDCTAGAFAGVCAAREGDLALVQLTGFMTLPAGDGLTPGTCSVTLTGGKAGKATTGGRPAIVTAVADGMAELVLL